MTAVRIVKHCRAYTSVGNAGPYRPPNKILFTNGKNSYRCHAPWP